ncbi:MAG TPA: DinB family protein [Gemmatimonadales bacterium]|nr:DinB family protein [Gemmatimonadales bacterium]
MITLTDVLLEEARTTYAVTEKLFRRVSDADLAWKPTAPGTEWMTTGQLLMHCACFGCGKAAHGFVTGDWGAELAEYGEEGTHAHLPAASELPSVASVAQALRLLEADRTLTLDAIAQADASDLLAGGLPAPWGGPSLTLFQHILHMIAHLAQHKGQLYYYLKLMGRDVCTADLWAA